MTIPTIQMLIRCALGKAKALPKEHLIRRMEHDWSIIELNFTYFINIKYLSTLHLKPTYQGQALAFSAKLRLLSSRSVIESVSETVAQKTIAQSGNHPSKYCQKLSLFQHFLACWTVSNRVTCTNLFTLFAIFILLLNPNYLLVTVCFHLL